jgi:two-component system sensor histidine kinase KdpD
MMRDPDRLHRAGLAALVWGVGWVAMLLLDRSVELGNLVLLPVLAAAIAGLWLSPGVSALVCVAAALAFNWAFVPPRGTFVVDQYQHIWLLLAMLAVAWNVAALVARQRSLAERERRLTTQAQQLHSMSATLRDTDETLAWGEALHRALSDLAGAPVTLMMLTGQLPPRDDAQAVRVLGEPTAEQLAGLWLCLRQAGAFGPGTGRHEDQPHWYFPLRGRAACRGAAQMPCPPSEGLRDDLRAHAQALCDQLGLSLERAQALRSEAAAREEAQSQQLRNTLLAAIAHDYRTPLATILGAASSLVEQDTRLGREQRQRLATTIVDEAERLTQLTANTLQLARLDAPGLTLTLGWESAEELVGAALARLRPRDPSHRLRSRVEPALPLLRCDALLVVQLLVNLLDNALKYAAPSPVELLVRRAASGEVMFAVRDRGPGVPAPQRDRLFELFQRGEPAGVRGAGVGLALCRAVARVHGARLVLRMRGHGGSSFEFFLPYVQPPTAAPEPT